MNRLVNNCGKRLVIRFDDGFSAIDEIMELSARKCRTKQFLLDLRVSSFGFWKGT